MPSLEAAVLRLLDLRRGLPALITPIVLSVRPYSDLPEDAGRSIWTVAANVGDDGFCEGDVVVPHSVDESTRWLREADIAFFFDGHDLMPDGRRFPVAKGIPFPKGGDFAKGVRLLRAELNRLYAAASVPRDKPLRIV